MCSFWISFLSESRCFLWSLLAKFCLWVSPCCLSQYKCYLVKGYLNVYKVTEIKCSLGKLRKSRMSASPFTQVKGWMTFPVILIRASLSEKTEWWFQHLQWNAEVEAGVCECRQHFISEEIEVWESGNLFSQSAWVSSPGSWNFLSPFAQAKLWTNHAQCYLPLWGTFFPCLPGCSAKENHFIQDAPVLHSQKGYSKPSVKATPFKMPSFHVNSYCKTSH